ncbi:uncharacterized protein F5147DRAFT_785111 [Suillus discolor]|uniref:Uncharacterized protein n=1 Tax=Suillus discolor TaxID=1912936 RepID=A0A9P7EQY8_9AGAM|nr:uncharacterized protein F5147DRAFT_785111 [Suillus discolor]KAG2079388.1 hypothetical protein F5147DRAFT_785111 [Suillus discolor]
MRSLLEDWLAYGTSHIGGTRCAPQISYTGALLNGRPTFDPYTDVPPGGCTVKLKRRENSTCVPNIPCFGALAISSASPHPYGAQCLGIGMLFMPYSPRWLVEQGREKEALGAVASSPEAPDNHSVPLIPGDHG